MKIHYSVADHHAVRSDAYTEVEAVLINDEREIGEVVA
jgi:hypothetical protein